MSRGNKLLLITSIGVCMATIDTTIVNVARDTLTTKLHASATGVSWVLSGYSIVYAAVLLTSGRLGDRYGRRRIYTAGLVLFAVASAACGLAPQLSVLIAARVVQAVGAAFIAPSALALVLPEFPVAERSTAVAMWGVINSTAAAAGPPLGSLLISAFGWRSAFFVNVPVGLVAYLAGRRVLPEARDPRTTGVPDPASIVCAVGAVGLIALAFTESNDWGFFGPGAIAAYAIGAAMIPVFLWRCRRAELPVLDLSLLGQRSFSSANAAALLFSIPFFGVLVADVSFVQEVWHYSVLKAGVATAITAVVGIFVSRGAGRLCDRHGHRAVLVPAALVLCASLFWRAAAVTTHPSYWTRWAGPMLALGLAIGALIPGLQSASVKYLPVDRMSMGSAFYTTVRQLGAALGVAVTVAMISRPHHGLLTNFRAAFIMHGIVGLVVTAIIAFGYRPPTGQAANQGLVMSVGE